MSRSALTLPSSWVPVEFDEAFDVLSDGGRRLAQSKYQETGPLPVIDQGEGLIGGYTDRETLAYTGPLPVIVFGDHTRRFKSLDFRFVVGAQGVKLLRPRPIWYAKFALFALINTELPKRGYSRHFQFLQKTRLPLAPLKEQERIVAEIEKQL